MFLTIFNRKKKPVTKELTDAERQARYEAYRAKEAAKKSLVKEFIALAKVKYKVPCKFKLNDEFILNSRAPSLFDNWIHVPRHHNKFRFFPSGVITNIKLETCCAEDRLETFLEKNEYEIGMAACRKKFNEFLNDGSIEKYFYYGVNVEFFDSDLVVKYELPEKFLFNAKDKNVQEIQRLGMQEFILEKTIKESKEMLEQVDETLDGLTQAC